jgi:hypothetical protein
MTQLDNRLDRRALLRMAGAGVAGTLAVAGMPGLALGASDNSSSPIEGAWQVTVDVTSPTVSSFDALYLFGRGGSFVRVDGRHPTIPTGLGAWRKHGDEIEFDLRLFVFGATGARIGTVSVPSSARVDGSQFTGTFVATGVATDANGVPTGAPLPGFPKAGTTVGRRIAP